MHGWANYVWHDAAKYTFVTLNNVAWWRMIRMLQTWHTPGPTLRWFELRG
jgi:hypothetical protein